MSRQEKFSHAATRFAPGKCDVSDLIFRFNCAKYFSTATGSLQSTQKDEQPRKEIEAIKHGGPSLYKQASSTLKQDFPNNAIFPNAGSSKSGIQQADGAKKGQKGFSIECSTTEAPRSRKKDITTKSLATSPSWPTSSKRSQRKETTIVVAVDATPTRGGGLLRLPGRERTILYYSVNWTNRFEIDDSTKFEMVNAALALELFEPYLKAYRGRYDKFVVKTDSHFYESVKGFKDPYDFQFLIEVREKVKSFEGEFIHALVSHKDPDIQNADYLSRTELPLGLKFGYDDNGDKSEDEATSYALVDLSSTASGHALDIISEAVPGKYQKGYNYA